LALADKSAYSTFASDGTNSLFLSLIGYNAALGGVVGTDTDANDNTRIILFKDQLANNAGKNSLNNLPGGNVLFTGDNTTGVIGPFDSTGVLFLKASTDPTTGNATSVEVDHLNGNGKLVQVGTVNVNTFIQDLFSSNAFAFDDSNNQLVLLTNPQTAGSAAGNFAIISLKDGSTTTNSTLNFPDSNFTQIQGSVLLDSTHVGLLLESSNTTALIFGMADLTSGQITNIGDCTGTCTNLKAVIPRNGLSPGVIAAIVIAVVAVVSIAGVIGCIIRRRRLNVGEPAK